MNLKPNETHIIGKWIVENGKVIADSASLRIEELVTKKFVEIGRADSGWTVLYLDKSDGQYWEKTYPNPEQQGGGAPSLSHLTRNEVAEKCKL
jgi:hypothetical protein